MEMDTVMVGSVALVVVLVRSVRDARFWHMHFGTISACRWVRADLDSWKGGQGCVCVSVRLCAMCAAAFRSACGGGVHLPQAQALQLIDHSHQQAVLHGVGNPGSPLVREV